MPHISHFEILGQDPEKLQSFYRDVFDWQVNPIPGMGYAMVDTGVEAGIAGGIGAPQDAAGGHATFYIEVDDPQAYLDKIEKLGGTTVVPVTAIPDMVTYAMFKDPSGNLVGLVKSAG